MGKIGCSKEPTTRVARDPGNFEVTPPEVKVLESGGSTLALNPSDFGESIAAFCFTATLALIAGSVCDATPG